jgi:ABC-2 type transport system ATP-binding protein
MIRIENFVKTYGSVRALDGLSLDVEPGVVYGFLGPNGAGKTTCMRILSAVGPGFWTKRSVSRGRTSVP